MFWLDAMRGVPLCLLICAAIVHGQGAPGVTTTTNPTSPGITTPTTPTSPAPPSGAPQSGPAASNLAAAQTASQRAVETGKNAVVADVAAIAAFGSSTQTDSAIAAANACSQSFTDAGTLVGLGVPDVLSNLVSGTQTLLNSLVSLVSTGSRPTAAGIAQQGQNSINEAARLAGVLTQAAIQFASSVVTASINVTTACGSCAALSTSEAFAISFGVPVKADAFATASCTVVCIQRCRQALDNGAYGAAAAGAATAATLTSGQGTGQSAGDIQTKVRRLGRLTAATGQASSQASSSSSPPNLTDAQKQTLGVVVASANSTAAASLYGVATLRGRGSDELQRLRNNVAAAVAITNAVAAAASLADPAALNAAQQAAATATGAAQAIAAGNAAAALANVGSFATTLAGTVGQVTPPLPGLETLRAAVAPSLAPDAGPGGVFSATSPVVGGPLPLLAAAKAPTPQLDAALTTFLANANSTVPALAPLAPLPLPFAVPPSGSQPPLIRAQSPQTAFATSPAAQPPAQTSNSSPPPRAGSTPPTTAAPAPPPLASIPPPTAGSTPPRPAGSAPPPTGSTPPPTSSSPPPAASTSPPPRPSPPPPPPPSPPAPAPAQGSAKPPPPPSTSSGRRLHENFL